MSWIRLVTTFAVTVVLCSLASARTWTSADGKFTVEAEFVELVDGTVFLRRGDGARLAIPLTQLSEADRHIVQSKAAEPQGDPSGNVASLLSAARTAMGQGKLSEAAKQIEQAAAQATTQSGKDHVEHAQKQHALLSTFWNAAIRVAQRLPATAELQIKETKVIVVESSDDLLVIRALGANCRFALDQPQTIPARLAIALASRGLPGGKSHAAVTAFSALNDGENDRALWEASSGRRLVDSPLPGSLPTDPADSGTPSNPATVPQPGSPSNFPANGSNPTGPDPSAPLGFQPLPQKWPAPAADEVLKKKQEIRELFAADFEKAATAQLKFNLAKKLFDVATETETGDPAAAFALYVEAARLTAEAGDAKSAFAILDRLSQNFEGADLLSRRTDALTSAIQSPISPVAVQFIGSEAFKLIERAVAESDFEAANQLADAALSAARRLKDRRIQIAIQQRQEQLKAEEQAYAKIAAAEKKLEQNPDDPAANLLVGIHYCKVKNDWSTGLEHLSRSQHTALAKLAEMDLAAPENDAKQIELGDAWWDLSEAEGTLLGDAAKVRAAHWYEQGLAGLSGLMKIKVEKRIQKAKELGSAGQGD